MPFRDRAKKLFRSKSRGNSLSTTPTTTSSTGSDRDRWPSNVYKPGEPMPRPKYRAPAQKEHTEKLEAFSFADAWRKSSFQSNYSPMGTRAQSRRTSFLSMHRKSVAGRSMSRKSIGGGHVDHGRSEGATTEETDETKSRASEALVGKLSKQSEAEGDDDVANVGLSRVHSTDRRSYSRPRTAEDTSHEPLRGLHLTMSTAHDHKPFSEHDLHLAMQRSHLQVPAH